MLTRELNGELGGYKIVNLEVYCEHCDKWYNKVEYLVEIGGVTVYYICPESHMQEG